jgi:hypothetical protein
VVVGYNGAQANQSVRHFSNNFQFFVMISQPVKIAFALFCMKIGMVSLVFALAVGHADTQGSQIRNMFQLFGLFL